MIESNCSLDPLTCTGPVVRVCAVAVLLLAAFCLCAIGQNPADDKLRIVSVLVWKAEAVIGDEARFSFQLGTLAADGTLKMVTEPNSLPSVSRSSSEAAARLKYAGQVLCDEQAFGPREKYFQIKERFIVGDRRYLTIEAKPATKKESFEEGLDRISKNHDDKIGAQQAKLKDRVGTLSDQAALELDRQAALNRDAEAKLQLALLSGSFEVLTRAANTLDEARSRSSSSGNVIEDGSGPWVLEWETRWAWDDGSGRISQVTAWQAYRRRYTSEEAARQQEEQFRKQEALDRQNLRGYQRIRNIRQFRDNSTEKAPAVSPPVVDALSWATGAAIGDATGLPPPDPSLGQQLKGALQSGRDRIAAILRGAPAAIGEFMEGAADATTGSIQRQYSKAGVVFYGATGVDVKESMVNDFATKVFRTEQIKRDAAAKGRYGQPYADLPPNLQDDVDLAIAQSGVLFEWTTLKYDNMSGWVDKTMNQSWRLEDRLQKYMKSNGSEPDRR